MAQTLKFGNGTWATKKGSTLAFNDEDGNFKPLPFTTTRATSATRVNKEGLIEVVESDRPRIDYTDSADGVLLLEKAATNLITYSEDFSNAYWVKDGASVASGFTSPSGDISAFKLVEGVANSKHRVGRATFASGTQRTFSVFAKKGERDYISLFDNNVVGDALKGVIFNLNTGTLSLNSLAVTYLNPTIKSLENGWYICSVTWTPASLSVPSVGSSADGLTNSYQGDGTSGIYIYGAQLEVGNVSSYIPTQGSAVTRVADTASGSGNSEVFNDSEGVLFANIASLADDGLKRSISINDGSSANRFILRFGITDNTIEFVSVSNNSALLLSSVTVSNTLISSKVAAKWDSNNYVFYVNGIIETTKNDLITPLVLNNLDFNDGNNNFNPFYGKTKEVACYDTVLTDLELETLTSYRSWLSMVNELNLNVIYNG